MKIKKIIINNFRGIKTTEINFSKDRNIFVGINGSGKTTILDAIVLSLSWLINRIRHENASGCHILESDIKNATSFSSIELTIEDNKKIFTWKLVKTAAGFKSEGKSKLTEVSELAACFQKILLNELSLPVIVCYPINRNVASFPAKLPKKNYNILDVYEGALTGKTDYESFFYWLKERDDIINENIKFSYNRQNQNKALSKKRIKKLLSYFEEATESYETSILDSEFIYENPKFLFRELIKLVCYVDIENAKLFRQILKALDSLMHKMSLISSHPQKHLIDSYKLPVASIKLIINLIEKLLNKLHQTEKRSERMSFKEISLNNKKRNLVLFIWDSFAFSILLNLWWINNVEKRKVEKLFKTFNPINNEKWGNVSEKLIKELNILIEKEVKLQNTPKNGDRELKYVTNTIEKFVQGYSNLQIKRIPQPHILLNKNGETFEFSQLSDGERNLIVLVGDIARRLTVANPNSKQPLKEEGIILIDEIDLHLHPRWQRLVIPKLKELFPNCQFIITTHSPQILSHEENPNNIFLLKNEKNVWSYSKALESYGKNTDRILEDLLETDARPNKTKKRLKKLYQLIADDEIEKAKNELSKLSKIIIGGDPELVKAKVLIKRKEIIGK